MSASPSTTAPSASAATEEDIQEQAANAAAEAQAKVDAKTAQVEADLATEARQKAATQTANEVFLVKATKEAVSHLTVAEETDKKASALAMTAAGERLAVAAIVVNVVDRLWATGEVDKNGRPKYDRKAYLAWTSAPRTVTAAAAKKGQTPGLGLGETQAWELYSIGREVLPNVPANLRNRFASMEAARVYRMEATRHGVDIAQEGLKAVKQASTGAAIKASVEKVAEARKVEAFEALTANEKKAARNAATRASNKATRDLASAHTQSLVDLFAVTYADGVKLAMGVSDKNEAIHTFAAFMLNLVDPAATDALRKCQATAKGIKDAS